jgi:hypothetical protein
MKKASSNALMKMTMKKINKLITGGLIDLQHIMMIPCQGNLNDSQLKQFNLKKKRKTLKE